MKNVFDKSIDTLVRLFRTKELANGLASDSSGTSTKNVNRSSRRADDERSILAKIEDALTNIEARGQGTMTGRVQVLRFDQLREELGEDWARLGSRIETVIESIIRQNVAAKDMHWRLAEHSYLLLFASLSPADAEIRCALIRAKIEEFFKGIPNLTGKVVVETAVATVDGKIQLSPLEDLKSLYDRLALARTESRGDGHLTGNEESSDVGREETNWRAVTDNIDTAREKIGSIKFVQRPIWDTSAKTVKFLAFMPVGASRNKSYSGGSILRAWTGGAMTLALDEASVEKVRKAQAEEVANQSKTIWFQVHYGTLENTRLRRELLNSFGAFDAASTSSRIVELIGLPKKIQLHSDSLVRQALRRCKGEVAACCDLVSPQFINFPAGEFDWVGFTMRDSSLEEAAAIEAISRFVKLAEGGGFEIYARDLPSQHVAEAAIAFGVRYIFSEHNRHAC